MKPAIINGHEIFDLHGNLWEWGHSLYGDRVLNRAVDPTGDTTNSVARVLRGGSWNNFPDEMKSSTRNNALPGYRDELMGFRLVRTLH